MSIQHNVINPLVIRWCIQEMMTSIKTWDKRLTNPQKALQMGQNQGKNLVLTQNLFIFVISIKFTINWYIT